MHEDGQTGLMRHGLPNEMGPGLQAEADMWRMGAENVEYDVLSCTFPCFARFRLWCFDHDDSSSNGMKMKSTIFLL